MRSLHLTIQPILAQNFVQMEWNFNPVVFVQKTTNEHWGVYSFRCGSLPLLKFRLIFPSSVLERIPPRHQGTPNRREYAENEWEIQINKEDRSEEETAQDGK